MASHQEQQVLDAAAELVAAFGAHDTGAYFGSFDPAATFVFHTHDEPLRSRAAYEQLWASWEREDGFHVVSCASADQHVQLLGEDVGVFTHRVHTVVRTSGGEEALDERETIVFQRDAEGQWMAVHEHLSPEPSAAS